MVEIAHLKSVQRGTGMRFAKQMIVTAVGGAMVLAPWSTWRATAQQPARVPQAQPVALNQDDVEANQALAERIAQSAQLLLSSSTMAAPSLRQSAAMFEAANRLAPTEPRFLRL